jgi:hypothetical protein
MKNKFSAIETFAAETAADVLSALICIGLGVWLLLAQRKSTAQVS